MDPLDAKAGEAHLWVKIWDETFSCHYYFNQKTQESTWIPPCNTDLIAEWVPPENSPASQENHLISTIWLGSLPPTATEPELIEVFGHYGVIVEVSIVRKNNSVSGDSTAFVRYLSSYSAKKALEDLSDGVLRIGHRIITGAWARSNSHTGAEYVPGHVHIGSGMVRAGDTTDNTWLRTLWMAGIANEISIEYLENMLRNNGFEAKVKTSKRPSRQSYSSKYNCFIKLSSHAEAERAKAFFEQYPVLWNGHAPISIDWAKDNSR